MKNQHGIVLLLPMLVIAGASITALIALSQSGIDALRMVTEEEAAFEERTAVFGCLDELLIQFAGDANFSATTVSIGEASCDVVIANSGGNNRSLAISRQAQGVTRRLEVDLIVDPVQVTEVREEMQ